MTIVDILVDNGINPIAIGVALVAIISAILFMQKSNGASSPEEGKIELHPEIMETTHNPVITGKDMLDPVNYDGIVFTSIDVVKKDRTAERPNRVTFSDSTVGSCDDKDALFIHNIREIKRGEGKGWNTTIDFEADELTPEEAVAVIGSEKKALFVIHGFNSQASFHLVDCRLARHKFKKTNLIPVIWPSEGKGGWHYFNDKKFSKAAGKALQNMKVPIQKLRNASIVCHSMGNRVFRNFSDPVIPFDNIFMVAADVDGDLFHEGYINGGMFGQNNEWRKHGSNIKGMLSNNDTGKIHVIYNPDDSRMFTSKFMNLGVRLGAAGVNFKPAWFGKTVHEDIKDSIVNVNAQEANMLYPEGPGKKDHNYHFHDNTVKYYEEHA